MLWINIHDSSVQIIIRITDAQTDSYLPPFPLSQHILSSAVLPYLSPGDSPNTDGQ